MVLDDAALSITRGLARREDSSRQLFIARLPRRTSPGPRGPQTALGQMSWVSRQIVFLSDNIDIAVEYILLNRYIGGQSTEYSHAGLSGPVGALPGFADIKLKLFCFITIVLFKRL